jgi:enoyl-CoA hydratase
VNEVLIRREGRAGRITLARPDALNALTHPMALEIHAALDEWRADPAVRLVILDGEGERAFCAGGDIREVYETARNGDFAAARRFWFDEYRMNAAIARYPKPIVALMHGFVMGGGVGLGGHASHRVVGESARVAMPECAIGLIPDVGGSFLLARAPGRLGEYLGLTGHRMGPADAIHAGFADRLVPEAAWGELTARLVEEGDPEPVAAFASPAEEAELPGLRERIDAAFAAEHLPALLRALEGDAWGREVIETLRGRSPLSMAATLVLVRAARQDRSIEGALTREYRFTFRSHAEGELLEGIRAAVIDRDRRPRWRDPIDGVHPHDVAHMLAPLGDDEWTPGPAHER